MKKLLSRGNSTMPSYVGVFNLPPPDHLYPLKVVPGQLLCPQKPIYMDTSVVKKLQWNYKMSKRRDFEDVMVHEIRRSYLKYVRVHIAGDFYSVKYVYKWERIARRVPWIIFRTNTKRQDLITRMMFSFPPNFVVRESLDPSRPNSMGVSPVSALEGTCGTKKFFVCPNDCEKCGFYCWNVSKSSILLKKL